MRAKRLMSDEEICKRYQAGESSTLLASAAGVTSRSIRNILKKHNIARVRSGQPRKYKVNEEFFKTWTHDMAWLLGMIVTDGWLINKPEKSQTMLAISQKDITMQDKIRKVLKSDHPYSVPTKTTTPKLIIGSSTIVKDLIELGVVPNKSLIMKMPIVPDQYMSSFIRGVIDGDGWVQKRGYVMNVTSGSLEFAKGLKKVFQGWELNCEITKEVSKTTGTVYYRIWVKGKYDLPKLANIIYQNCGDGLYYSYKRENMERHASGQMELYF